MLNKKDFKSLVGKEIKAALDEDNSVSVKVDSIEDLPAPETDDENVRKDPFRVMLSTAIDCRLPEGIINLAGGGVDADLAVSACCAVGDEVERHTYEVIFA